MAGVFYSESFVEQAQSKLREMIEKNLDKISYGKPFSNFYIVIGETDKTKVMLLDVPEDLKSKIGDKKVYVITE